MFMHGETYSAFASYCWDVTCFFLLFCFSRAQNFTRKIAAGITATVEMKQLKVEIEKKATGSAMEISLSLHHDVEGLIYIVPRVLEVSRNPAM